MYSQPMWNRLIMHRHVSYWQWTASNHSRCNPLLEHRGEILLQHCWSRQSIWFDNSGLRLGAYVPWYYPHFWPNEECQQKPCGRICSEGSGFGCLQFVWKVVRFQHLRSSWPKPIWISVFVFKDCQPRKCGQMTGKQLAWAIANLCSDSAVNAPWTMELVRIQWMVDGLIMCQLLGLALWLYLSDRSHFLNCII